MTMSGIRVPEGDGVPDAVAASGAVAEVVLARLVTAEQGAWALQRPGLGPLVHLIGLPAHWSRRLDQRAAASERS